MSRSELGAALQLSPTSMTKITAELIAAGYIAEAATRMVQGVGRPKQGLHIVGRSLRILSILVEPRSLEWAHVNLALDVERTGTANVDVGGQPASKTLASIARLCEEHADAGPLHGIAVALPGFVDDDMRSSIRAPHINWRNENVADVLEDLTRLPVAIYNNARAMGLAEFHHLRVPEGESLLFVQARRGLGAALVETASTRSRHQVVTELGDIHLGGVGGSRRPGAARLHEVINEQYLRSQLGVQDANEEVLVLLELAVAAGDARARRLRAATLERLAYGLGIAVDLLNPRILVLGGILAPASDVFVDELAQRIRRFAIPNLADQLKLRRSELANTGALLGAQIAAVDRFFASGLF
jgi:predicted NBD/HSP70 family sugar kinase